DIDVTVVVTALETCNDIEGDRDGHLGLVEIRDVVDEGPVMSGVDEPETRCTAEAHDHGVDDAVQTCMGRRERLVDRVGPGEVRRVVVAPFPCDTGPFGLRTVDAAHPCTFTPAKLMHRRPRVASGRVVYESRSTLTPVGVSTAK